MFKGNSETAIEDKAAATADSAPEEFVPLDGVLAAVRACGEEVTVDQLDRWRHRGLLPARLQRHHHGRVGSVSGYPAAVIDQNHHARAASSQPSVSG